MKLSRIDYIALNGGDGEHYDMDILERLNLQPKVNGSYLKDIGDAIKEIEKLRQEAAAMYAAGAEAMRERAASTFDGSQNMGQTIARVIRALPITTNTEGERDERKDYCGSCGEWTGGPLICCHESESANRKPNITKTEAITVRQTRKESSDDYN